MRHKIAGHWIEEDCYHLGTEEGDFDFYMLQTEIEYEHGMFQVYVNEFGIEDHQELVRLYKAYRKRDSRMGVELYDADGVVLWSRPVLSP